MTVKTLDYRYKIIGIYLLQTNGGLHEPNSLDLILTEHVNSERQHHTIQYSRQRCPWVGSTRGSGLVGSGHGNWLQPWVGSGRVQFLCVSIFCHVKVFWRHIRNGGRQLHNYTGWLVTKGCLPTILKCEETLCVEQLDTVVYSHLRRRHDTDSIWCAHSVIPT